ncbi:hypothetical protein J6590_036581 [Homalodisca vitripennis]|nr:hypothetical protein J6590_036581 [Homalodisca vitripennis]
MKATAQRFQQNEIYSTGKEHKLPPTMRLKRKFAAYTRESLAEEMNRSPNRELLKRCQSVSSKNKFASMHSQNASCSSQSYGSQKGEVIAKKPSLKLNLRTNGLKDDFRITTKGRAGGLLARSGSLSGHSSKQQPRSTLLDLVILR